MSTPDDKGKPVVTGLALKPADTANKPEERKSTIPRDIGADAASKLEEVKEFYDIPNEFGKREVGEIKPGQNSYVNYDPSTNTYTVNDTKETFTVTKKAYDASILNLTVLMKGLEKLSSFNKILKLKQVNSYDAQLFIFLRGGKNVRDMKIRVAFALLASVVTTYGKFVEELNKGFMLEDGTVIKSHIGILDFVNNSKSAKGSANGEITFSFLQALGYVLGHSYSDLGWSVDDFFLPYVSKFETAIKDSYVKNILFALFPVKEMYIPALCKSICLFHFKAHVKFETGNKNEGAQKKRNWATIFRKHQTLPETYGFLYFINVMAPDFFINFISNRMDLKAPLAKNTTNVLNKAEIICYEIMNNKHADKDEEMMINFIESQFLQYTDLKGTTVL